MPAPHRAIVVACLCDVDQRLAVLDDIARRAALVLADGRECATEDRRLLETPGADPADKDFWMSNFLFS